MSLGLFNYFQVYHDYFIKYLKKNHHIFFEYAGTC